MGRGLEGVMRAEKVEHEEWRISRSHNQAADCCLTKLYPVLHAPIRNTPPPSIPLSVMGQGYI